MAGNAKNTLDKITDAIGGTAGKVGASMTNEAGDFVQSAAIGDLYEITAGKLALKRSRDETVRSLARKMVDDHTASTHHMMAALEMNETRGVEPPPQELDARRQTMIDHLEQAPDDTFDRTYLDQQALAHEETVSLMRNYSMSGDNPQLRSLALGTLPVVERHLEHVTRLRAEV